MRTFIRWLAVWLLVALAGCASTHPVVGAWRAKGLTPQRTDKIALTARPNPGEADAQLGRLLVPELEAAGFKMVPGDQADYFLAYAVEDDSTVEPRQNQPAVGKPVSQMAARQGLRLYLYTNPKTHNGRFDVAWSGCIDAGEKVSADDERRLIRALLRYFGATYNGTVDLHHPPK